MHESLDVPLHALHNRLELLHTLLRVLLDALGSCLRLLLLHGALHSRL